MSHEKSLDGSVWQNPVGVYFNDDCSPKCCTNCAATEFSQTIKEQVEGSVCEYSIMCDKCGTELGYWAYGNFNPDYVKRYVEEIQSTMENPCLPMVEVKTAIDRSMREYYQS